MHASTDNPTPMNIQVAISRLGWGLINENKKLGVAGRDKGKWRRKRSTGRGRALWVWCCEGVVHLIFVPSPWHIAF